MRTSIFLIRATRAACVFLWGAQASWNCSAFAGGRSELECRTPQSLRSRVLHQGHRHFRSDIYFVCQTTPVEFAQACFLTLTEIKEKMFAIIFSAELGRNLRLRRDQVIEAMQVPIAKLSQGVGY